MSLILEALKKSERERRLGESPSLGSPIMPVRRRRSLLPPLIALIAIGLGVYWWLNRVPSASPESVVTSTPAPVSPGQDAPAPTPASSSENVVITNEPPQSTAAERLPHSRVPADPTTGLRPDLREKVKSGEIVVANPQLLKPGQPATIKESEAMPAGADAPMPPGTPGHAPVAVATPTTAVAGNPAENAKRVETPNPAPTAGTAAPNATAKAAPAQPIAKPPVVPVSPPAPAATPIASGPAVALIWELPYAKRRELPELKLTMHVFAAVPAQRFVIINGNRQVEGDDIDGLRVVEIRPDGVVFEHQGQRFLYPRGGR